MEWNGMKQSAGKWTETLQSDTHWNLKTSFPFREMKNFPERKWSDESTNEVKRKYSTRNIMKLSGEKRKILAWSGNNEIEWNEYSLKNPRITVKTNLIHLPLTHSKFSWSEQCAIWLWIKLTSQNRM